MDKIVEKTMILSFGRATNLGERKTEFTSHPSQYGRLRPITPHAKQTLRKTYVLTGAKKIANT